MTKRIVIALLWLSAFALGQTGQTQLGNVSVKALTIRSLAGSNGCLNIVAGLVGSTGVACGSGGGGGSMTWPGGVVSGIPAYSYPNAWGTTYNSSNQIPTNFLAILGSTNTFTGANTFGTTFFNNAATFYSTLQVNSATTSLFGNLYVGQNIYANAQPNGLSGAFSSLGSLATLSTQNAQNWHAEGQYGGFAVSQTNTMALIFGNSGSISGGRLHASWNGGGDNTIGYLTDPISGNAGTASALVTTPTQCSGAGNFATGIQANGNANCNQPNVIQVQETTPALCNSLFLCIYGSSATHGPVYSENGGPILAFGAYPNFLQQDSTGANPANTLEEISGTNTQTLRLYNSFISSSNFNRLQFSWDAANTAWQFGCQWGSSGGYPCDLEFATGSVPTVHWHMSSASPFALLPNVDNSYDIGCVPATCPGGGGPYQVRNLDVVNLYVSGIFKMTGTGPNQVTATLNTSSVSNPGSGYSGYSFDTIANGGVFAYYENGTATSPTAALATKAPLANPAFPKVTTAANCSSSASPAVCGSASAGSFAIAASATSVVVDTTAVTANSQIFVQQDDTLGTKLSVTCNTGILAGPPAVTARSAATSFTVSVTAGLTVNPVCFSYFIVN